MPLYSYRCPSCDSTADHYNSIANRHEGPACCGAPMRQSITAATVIGEMKPYYCVATSQMVTSREQRRKVIKEHGLVEAG